MGLQLLLLGHMYLFLYLIDLVLLVLVETWQLKYFVWMHLETLHDAVPLNVQHDLLQSVIKIVIGLFLRHFISPDVCKWC